MISVILEYDPISSWEMLFEEALWQNASYFLSFDKEDEGAKNDLDDKNNKTIHKITMEREMLQLLEMIVKLCKAQM